MDMQAAEKMLQEKLDPRHVKKPSGRFGPKGDYIEGWHAIAEANRIFGHFGWSYTIVRLTQDVLAEATNGKGEKQWQAAYTALVSVTVADVTRQDVGFGSGFAKQAGDAIEGATKEAVTDALKRALRTFGSPLGLALYDKTRENVGTPTDPAPKQEKKPAAKPAEKYDAIAARDSLLDAYSFCKTKQHVDDISALVRKSVEALYHNDRERFAEVKALKDKLMRELPDDPARQAPDAA